VNGGVGGGGDLYHGLHLPVPGRLWASAYWMGVESTFIPRLAEDHTVLYGKMIPTVYAAVRGRWKPVYPSGSSCWREEE